MSWVFATCVVFSSFGSVKFLNSSKTFLIRVCHAPCRLDRQNSASLILILKNKLKFSEKVKGL